MADMRRCIGSAKFGIEAHEAPVTDFPAQPSQKDGLGRMCKPHWNAYTNALRKAALARAANVLRFDPEGWLADNTDGVGLVRDIERNAGVPLAGKRVLLIGAGGAAAGVLGPLLGARPAQIVVANRTTARAEELVARHLGAAGACQLLVRSPDDCGVGFDLAVNATTSSLEGAAPPVNARVLAPGALALDMMYGAPSHAFVAWANLHGARGRDGLGMLVEQAAQAFELWRGVCPDTAPVLAALRARLSGAQA